MTRAEALPLSYKTSKLRLSEFYYTHEMMNVYVVVQFYPWFNFDFPLFFSMLIYNNEYQTKENQN